MKDYTIQHVQIKCVEMEMNKIELLVSLGKTELGSQILIGEETWHLVLFSNGLGN